MELGSRFLRFGSQVHDHIHLTLRGLTSLSQGLLQGPGQRILTQLPADSARRLHAPVHGTRTSVCPHSRGWGSCFPLVFGLRLSDLTPPPDTCSGRAWVGCGPRTEPFTSGPDPQAAAIGGGREQWRLSAAWGLRSDAERKAVPCRLSRADWRVSGTGGSDRRVPPGHGLGGGFTFFSHQKDSFILLSFPHALPLRIRESSGSHLSVRKCFLSASHTGRRRETPDSVHAELRSRTQTRATPHAASRRT